MPRDNGGGCLVALEGTQGVLTTQLRLLPQQPNILVLPALQQYLEDGDDANLFAAPAKGATTPATSSSFNARRFIRQVHKAASRRRDIALDFLQSTAGETGKDSTSKIVFLNGGTATSRTVCIEALRDYDDAADGNLQRAAELFDEFIADGVAGLEDDNQSHRPDAQRADDSANDDDDSVDDDPITRAMRAADALDKKTEALQQNRHVLDLTPQRASLRYSMPDMTDLESHRLSHLSDQSSIWATSATGTSSFDFLSSPSSTIFPASMRPEAVASGMSWQTVPTPRHAYYPAADERQPVLIGPPPRGRSRGRSGRRARSLERKPLTSNQPSSESMGMSFLLSRESSSRRQSVASEATTTGGSVLLLQATKTPAMSMTGSQDMPNVPEVPEIPADALAKLDKLDKKPASLASVTRTRKLPAIYVDRGTDAGQSLSTAFEAVLPWTEDVVVRFDDGTPATAALDFVIQRYTGKLINKQRSKAKDEQQALPASPTTSEGQPASEAAPASLDDYDPFAPGEYIATKLKPPPPLPVMRPKLPTPAQTPPPLPEAEQQNDDTGAVPTFHGLPVAEFQTPVALQNALRDVIDDSLPSTGNGRKQSGLSFLWLPEADRRRWAPLLLGGAKSNRIDLVLALGAHKSVPPDFVARITDRLAALGRQSTGATRTGRLDVRLLVVNAMQAWMAQEARSRSATHGQHDDPFARPGRLSKSKRLSQLLAMLVVPQLDLYLQTHPSVRFLLLDYPSELVGVMLALQRLVGRNAVQLASIIGAESISSRSSGQVRQGTQASPTLSIDDTPLGQANFVLTAASGEADVAAFVTAIWKRLATASGAYHGQNPAKSVSRTPSQAAGERRDTVDSVATTVTAATTTTTMTTMSSMSSYANCPPSPVLSTMSRRSRASTTALSGLKMPMSSLSNHGGRLLAKTIQGSGALRVRSADSEKDAWGANMGSGGAYEDDSFEDDNDDDDDDDLDNDLDMRRLMPLFLRDRTLLAAKHSRSHTCGSRSGSRGGTGTGAANQSGVAGILSRSKSSWLMGVTVSAMSTAGAGAEAVANADAGAAPAVNAAPGAVPGAVPSAGATTAGGSVDGNAMRSRTARDQGSSRGSDASSTGGNGSQKALKLLGLL